MKLTSYNLFSNKELSPSEKITLIGIEDIKIYTDDGNIQINLNDITNCTAINNRSIRRNLKSFEEKNILLPATPNEEGKLRHLVIQPKYTKLFDEITELDKSSRSGNSKVQSHKPQGSREIRIIEEQICRNSELIESTRSSMNEEIELDWVDIVVNMNEKDFTSKALIVNDAGEKRYVIQSML